MKQKIKITPIILMVGLTCILSFILFNKTIIAKAVNKGEKNKINIVLESSRHNKVVPKRLRKTTSLSTIENREDLNLEGLNTLNISGSQQFTPNNIELLITGIDTDLPITVVDLREESHGFVNGSAISFTNDRNNPNEGLSREEVLLDEKTRLSELKLGEQLTFFNKPFLTLEVDKVKTEEELTKEYGLNYVRITVTDKTMPKDEMVDYFIEFANSLEEENWLHFHCKHGVGRTSTFMIMFDVMKNHKISKLEDIINRQLAMYPFKEDTIDNYLSPGTVKFLNNFYNYVKENSDDYKVKWSEYNKK